MTDPIQFPVQRYTFNWLATTNISLPVYSGSILRGHFGNQLRRTVCFTKQENCKGCPLIRRCSYGKMYESIPHNEILGSKFNKLPHPYLIEPLPYRTTHLPQNSEFQFSMVLFGDTLLELPLIVFIWEQVFTRGLRHHGNCGSAQLQTITMNNKSIIYTTSSELNEQSIRPHQQYYSLQHKQVKHIKIRLLTPLRLQGRKNEKQIIIGCDLFDARCFIQALLRRITLLANIHEIDLGEITDLYSDLNEIILSNSNLHWSKTKRYSGQQKAEMEFYGIIGDFELNGNQLTILYPWLKLGEYSHLGKSSTFGFGHYQVIEID